MKEVASGDVVHLWTVSGEPGGVPLDKYDVPEELQAIWKRQCGAEDGSQPGVVPPATFCGAPGPHILTGPVAVKNAQPGDILKVEVLSAEPWATWGWNSIRQGKGTLGKTPEYENRPGETVGGPQSGITHRRLPRKCINTLSTVSYVHEMMRMMR